MFCRFLGWGLLVGVVCFGVACESFWDLVIGEEPVRKPKIVKKDPLIKKELQLPDPVQVKRDCESWVQSHKNLSKVDFLNDGMAFQLQSDKIIDDLSLSQWLVGFAEKIFIEKECPWDQLSFSTSFDDQKIYTGLLRRSDFKLFKKDRISQAELYRRFEIKALETKLALRTRLKKARYLNQHSQALSLVNELLEKESDQNLRLVKANIYLEEGSWFEALALYDLLLQESPGWIEVLFNKAHVQKQIGSFSEAVQTYKKLLEAFAALPEDQKPFPQSRLWLNLSDAYLKNRNLSLAEESLSKVTVRDLNYKILQAAIWRAQKKYQEAVQLFEALVQDQSADAMVRFNLVLLYLDLRDQHKAKEAYQSLKSVSETMAKELEFIPLFGGTGVPTLPADSPMIKNDQVIKPADSFGPVGPMDQESTDQPLF